LPYRASSTGAPLLVSRPLETVGVVPVGLVTVGVVPFRGVLGG